jgi:hypothetical protein
LVFYFEPPTKGAGEDGVALNCQDRLPDNTKAINAIRMKIPET